MNKRPDNKHSCAKASMTPQALDVCDPPACSPAPTDSCQYTAEPVTVKLSSSHQRLTAIHKRAVRQGFPLSADRRQQYCRPLQASP
jgi:hypothetical protein